MNGGVIYCLYHASCSDGLGAAWSVWKRFPQAVCTAVYYNRPVPIQPTGDDTVIVVDFSYDMPEMEKLRDSCAKLIFLDHHHRSKEIVERLEATRGERHQDTYEYDNDRSGALMAWDFFHGPETRPHVIQHISDRDLWTFSMEGTRDFMTALGSYPQDLDVWKDLPLESDAFCTQMIAEAPILRRQFDTFKNAIVRCTYREIVLAGHRVPFVNVPAMYASEMLGELALKHPFAVGYYDTRSHRLFSLRSEKGRGVNVREIAEKFNGGGHNEASGFRVPRNHKLATI